MTDKTLAYLDYTRLLGVIKKHSATPYSSELIKGLLKPPSGRSYIREQQDRIDALLEIVQYDGPIPLTIEEDVRAILKSTSIPDYVLEPKQFLLLSNFIKACSEALRFLKKAYKKSPYIESIIGRLDPLAVVQAQITKTINHEGYIEDTASYELSKIRSDLFLYKEKTKRHIEKIMERDAVRSMLQDNYISIRNNRYVIPLKPNFNQVLQGIVHDYSHSLKTSFVEPVEVVEQCNMINILEKEEKEEEKRILKDLTSNVRKFKDRLQGNLIILGELDFYHSIAMFSREFECVRPEVGEDDVFEIVGARNPFIVMSKGKEAVPVDIHLDRERRAMVISGPNAGGKTAALKTIGLMTLMAQSGLFIPAMGKPKVPFYSKIYAVIGDEQDISMELSSFTAHIIAIRDLYEKADEQTLVLIDEIGGGTEPQEASALSMGIIDSFVEKGARIAVTTHLNLLKAYGYTNDFAINVATAFDLTDMKPLYRLTYGTAGYSNAINVAKNISLPEEIIEKSYQYLGEQEVMLSNLIDALEREKLLLEDERKQLSVVREEARKRLANIKEKKNQLLDSYEARLEAKLLQFEDDVEEIKKEIAKKEKDAIKIAKSKINLLRKRHEKTLLRKEESLNVGDFVYIKSLGESGYISGVERENIFEVIIGNIRTKVHKRYLEKKSVEKTASVVERRKVDVEQLAGPEINLMGMRVEEAIEELSKFVDRAVVGGYDKVKVRHGIGSGRLMVAVKNHLSELSYVKSIQSDERNKGITIVELK